MRAIQYNPWLKNMILQKKLNISCTAYISNAYVFSSESERTIIYDAIPISMYRMVHTTGKSHPGGDNLGFTSVLNVVIASLVINDETNPTINGIATHIINVIKPGFSRIFIHLPFIISIIRFALLSLFDLHHFVHPSLL